MGMSELTDRQREILKRVAEGKTNAAIGQELCISEYTVRNHMEYVYDKLGIETASHGSNGPRVVAAVMYTKSELNESFTKMMQFATLVVEHGQALKDYE